MRNWWLRFSCFLTGYNYEIISASSWISRAIVLKNMSAMLSICLIWALIGFAFGKRYLKLEVQGSLLIAVGLVFIVIQIERQITMSISKKPFLLIFRSVIGFSMALLGALLFDQILFSTDIEHKKLQVVDRQVDLILKENESKDSLKLEMIDGQIQTVIERRNFLTKEISQRPILKLVDSESRDDTEAGNTNLIGSSGMIKRNKSRAIVNPNIELLVELGSEIQQLRQEKQELINKEELNRNEIKSRLLSNSGFTEESRILFLIFKESPFALFVWICLTFIILAMELLILVNKIGEPKTDYDKKLERELREHISRIDYQDDSFFL